MNFIEGLMDGAINRYRTTMAIALLMTLAGIFSLQSIPVESDPSITVPMFLVTVYHEGISPEDGERLIVMPLETEIRSVEGVEKMRAYASESRVSMMVEFDVSFPIDRARTSVREAIDRAKAKFPEDSEEPFLNEFTTADEAVIAINFAGDGVPERVLFELASALKDEIESLPEVLEANLSGQREELLEAVIEPSALEHYGISMGEVAAAVMRNNRLIAAGSIDTGEGRFSVKVPSIIENAQDLFEIPVKTVNGDVITVLAAHPSRTAQARNASSSACRTRASPL